MGEMADMAIESIMDAWEDGAYGDDDYRDHGGGGDPFFGRAPRTDIECKYCHKRVFHWARISDGSWRLHTPSGKVHTCLPFTRQGDNLI